MQCEASKFCRCFWAWGRGRGRGQGRATPPSHAQSPAHTHQVQRQLPALGGAQLLTCGGGAGVRGGAGMATPMATPDP